MAETVEIIINAKDQASGVLKGISGGISGLGKVALGVAKVGLAGLAVGVGALATGLGIALSEAMEAQEGMAQLDAVLKSTGGAAGVTRDMALDLADSLSQVTRFSDDAVLAGENMLLTFTNIGADVFPMATEIMLDMSQALGQDLKTSAIQLGKALNEPISGVTSLERVGVKFTDATKDQIAAMVEAGDVAGAQAIILQELQTEFGGSAEAAGATFAGQLDILKNSLLNVAEGVGMALLPSLQTMAETVMTNILPAIQEFGAWLEVNLPIAIATFGEFWASTLQPALSELWTWLSVNLPPAIQTLADFWTDTLQPALAIVGEWITGTLFPALSELWTWLSINIPPAIQALSDFWQNTLWPAMQTVWEWMQGSLFPLLDDLVKIYFAGVMINIAELKFFWEQILLPAIQTVWNWVSGTLFPLFVTLADWLGPILTTAIQGLSDFWTGTLQPALQAVWDFIQADLFPLFQALSDFFDAAFTLAVTAMAGLWQNVLQPALAGVWEFIQDNLFPIFESIAGWLDETFGPIIDNLISSKLGPLQEAFGAVRDAIKWVIDKLAALTTKIQNFSLPPILTPGSPTQFELGLRGIGDAFDDLSKNKIPAFNDAFGKGMFGNTSGGGAGGIDPTIQKLLDMGIFISSEHLPPGYPTSGATGLGSPVGAGGPMTTGGGTGMTLIINNYGPADSVFHDMAMLEQLAAAGL